MGGSTQHEKGEDRGIEKENRGRSSKHCLANAANDVDAALTFY